MTKTYILEGAKRQYRNKQKNMKRKEKKREKHHPEQGLATYNTSNLLLILEVNGHPHLLKYRLQLNSSYNGRVGELQQTLACKLQIFPI